MCPYYGIWQFKIVTIEISIYLACIVSVTAAELTRYQYLCPTFVGHLLFFHGNIKQ